MKTVHSIERMPEEYEELLLEFDEAWKSNEPPEIAEFTPEDAPASFLVELVRIDLERRVTTNRNITVETYLEQVPRLATIANILSSLSDYEHQLKERRERQCFPVIAGYRIDRELGRGGMGVVYLARHEELNRLVAIKIILSAEYVSVDAKKRFLTEASTIAKLQHPQIIQIHDIGQYQNTPYFTLEYLSGGNLSKKLSGQPMESKSAAQLIAQLAEGVQAIHEQGVIHRDLKPANVLFTRAGDPKITDFGLAKVENNQQTQSGEVLGTPCYMAPEQASGEVQYIVPATDVYALGAILYECLTGRPPFQGATILETLNQVIEHDPLPLRRWRPTLPVPLETICLKCLAKQPNDRYSSAVALHDDLQRFLQDRPILARPPSLWQKGMLWSKRHPDLARSLLVLIVVIVSSLGVVTYLWLESNQESSAKSKALLLAQTLKRYSDEVAIEAQKEAIKSKKTAEILISVFEASDPLGLAGLSHALPRSTGEDLSARELLKRSASKVAEQLKDQPEVEAAVRESIGKAYISLGLMQEAESHLTRSLQLRRELLGESHQDTASSLFTLGWLRMQQGFMDEAEELILAARTIFQTHPEGNELQIATCVRHLGLLATVNGDYPEANRYLNEALEVFQRFCGTTSHDVLVTRILQCLLYIDELEAQSRGIPSTPNLGRLLRTFKDVLDILNSTQANRPLAQAVQLQMEALVLLQAPNLLGSYDRAESHLKKALVLLEAQLGQNHLYTAFTLWALVQVSSEKGQVENQLHYYQKCMEVLRQCHCLYHQKAIWIIHEYGLFLLKHEQMDKAQALWDQLFADFKKSPRLPKRAHAYALHCYSIFLKQARLAPPEYERVTREAIKELSSLPRRALFRYEIGCLQFHLAQLLHQQKRNSPEVMQLCNDSRSLLLEFYQRPHEDLALIDELQGSCLERQREFVRALLCYHQALEVFVKLQPKLKRRLHFTWAHTLLCQFQLKNYSAAIEDYWRYAEHGSTDPEDQFQLSQILSTVAAHLPPEPGNEAMRQRANCECFRLLNQCAKSGWLTKTRMEAVNFPKAFKERIEFSNISRHLP